MGEGGARGSGVSRKPDAKKKKNEKSRVGSFGDQEERETGESTEWKFGGSLNHKKRGIRYKREKNKRCGVGKKRGVLAEDASAKRIGNFWSRTSTSFQNMDEPGDGVRGDMRRTGNEGVDGP